MNLAPPPRARRATLTIAFAAALLAGCGRPRDGEGALVLSGNIELVDAHLAFKLPGRVATRLVAEGEPVTAGQLVAQLDDAEQAGELALRRAELAAADAALAELLAGSRPQEIAAAEAALRRAEAERERTRLEFDRQRELRAQDAISPRELEAAQAEFNVTDARARETAQQLELVREGPRAETIAQARARRAQAAAAVGVAETRLAQTRLLSPLAGVVLSHHIEPGEYVSPGTPVVTVADPVHVWVRTYVPEPELGRIRHGQQVRVRTDTYPDKPYEGTVSFIAAEAEFTPKTVQTAAERVKLVFRIKVDVTNPDGELKAGMPADVILPPDPPAPARAE